MLFVDYINEKISLEMTLLMRLINLKIADRKQRIIEIKHTHKNNFKNAN